MLHFEDHWSRPRQSDAQCKWKYPQPWTTQLGMVAGIVSWLLTPFSGSVFQDRDLESQVSSFPVLHLQVAMKLNSHQWDVCGDPLKVWETRFFSDQKKVEQDKLHVCVNFRAWLWKQCVSIWCLVSCSQEENIKRTAMLPGESSNPRETLSHVSRACTKSSDYISTSISSIKVIISPRSFASTITMSNYYIIKWSINFCITCIKM